jgi:hypothetical protein
MCRVRPSLQRELEAAGSGTEPLAASFPASGARARARPRAAAAKRPRGSWLWAQHEAISTLKP